MQKFSLSEEQFTILENIFKQHSSVTKVIIFGSRAKNTHKQYSDIDLCLMGKIDDNELNKLNNNLIESSLIYKVDLVVFENVKNNLLKENIVKDGLIFWERIK